MGCGSSKGKEPGKKKGHGKADAKKDKKAASSTASDDEAVTFDPDCDPEFESEAQGKRNTYDPKTKTWGQKDACDRNAKRPEDLTGAGGMFQVESAGAGDQFMAVKPWKGQIEAPSDCPPVDGSAPAATLTLEHVYGFRTVDVRNHCYLVNGAKEVCFPAAACGVCMNVDTYDQRIFGGDNVKGAKCHDDDILCLEVSPSRKFAASGQNGRTPKVKVWDIATAAITDDLKLNRGGRSCVAIAWSSNENHLAAVDNSNDHNIYIWAGGAGKFSKPQCNKGPQNKIVYAAWSRKDGHDYLNTVGVKYCSFWDTKGWNKNGLYGKAGNASSHSCVSWDDCGNAYTAGTNGHAYKWEGEKRTLCKSKKAGKMIVCIQWIPKLGVVAGHSNGEISKMDDNLDTHEVLYNYGSAVRSIDIDCGFALIATNDTEMYLGNLATKERKVIHTGHSEGEVWGLAYNTNDNTIVTTGDDNCVCVWDWQKKCNVTRSCIDAKEGAERKPGHGASTLATTGTNQQSRAVAFNPTNGNWYFGKNDGTFVVSAEPNFDAPLACHKDSKEWIEAISVSPTGDLVAVGSHDNTVYLYETAGNTLCAKCTGHSSFITAIDWSCDGEWLRSNCGAYELLYFSKTGERNPNGRTELKDCQWATHTCKISWETEGVFLSGYDGSDVNFVTTDATTTVVASFDDFGQVNLFRYPVRGDSGDPKSNSYIAHSEHVVRGLFNPDNTHLFSVGGYDQTLMQWKYNC